MSLLTFRTIAALGPFQPVNLLTFLLSTPKTLISSHFSCFFGNFQENYISYIPPDLTTSALKASSFEGVFCRFQRHKEMRMGPLNEASGPRLYLASVSGLDGRSGLQVIIVSPILGSVGIFILDGL